MPNGLELAQNTMFTVMRDYINNSLIVNYGIILEVYSQKSVRVAVMSSLEDTTVKLDCSVMFTSSTHLEVSHKLEVGEKGIILSLQNMCKDTFKAEEPVLEAGRKGYSVLNCVFIPYNTLKEADETTTKITLDDEQILLKTKVPVTIESEKEVIVDATEVQLCGDSKTMVTYAELNTALGNFKTSITSALTSLITSHAHNITAPGTPSGPGVGVTPTIVIDISSAEAKKVKTS